MYLKLFFSARYLCHVFKASRTETSDGQLFWHLKCIVYETNKKYCEILTIYDCVEK